MDDNEAIEVEPTKEQKEDKFVADTMRSMFEGGADVKDVGTAYRILLSRNDVNGDGIMEAKEKLSIAIEKHENLQKAFDDGLIGPKALELSQVLIEATIRELEETPDIDIEHKIKALTESEYAKDGKITFQEHLDFNGNYKNPNVPNAKPENQEQGEAR